MARADAYVCGHDRGTQQHLSPGGGIFAFAVLEADAEQMAVMFVGSDLERVYQYKLKKD